MRLSHLTLTGADDSVDPEALARLSAEAPFVEWGVLFDAVKTGQPRFPSAAWRREFHKAAPLARRSAHICGTVHLEALAYAATPNAIAIGREVCGFDPASPHGYQRVQLNFDALRLPLSTVTGLVASWRSGRWRRADGSALGLITQHNDANVRLHELFIDPTVKESVYPHYYSVLFDDSGGRGELPRAWPAPFGGFRCGYAGGIRADNVAQVLRDVSAKQPVDARPVWLDLESGLRSADHFDLDKVAQVIDAIRAQTSRGKFRIDQHLTALP